MTEKLRKHTIIVTKDNQGRITGLQLEKDWYSASFADLYDYRVVTMRPQGAFFFVGFGMPITQTQAKLFTDNVILGKITTIDLREYAYQKQVAKKKAARRA